MEIRIKTERQHHMSPVEGRVPMPNTENIFKWSAYYCIESFYSAPRCIVPSSYQDFTVRGVVIYKNYTDV